MSGGIDEALGWVFGVVAALALVAAIAAVLLRRRRSNGMVRMADAIPVHSKFWRDERKKNGDLLYVAIGDSAAQGIGASRPDRGYVGRIAAHVRETTGRSVRVANLSQSGGRLREILEWRLPKLRALDPEVLTVAIGANDIAGFDAERFEREFRELLAALPSHTIVADLPSFYVGKGERDARTACSIIARLAAERSLDLVPLHAATTRQSVARYALNQVAADFFHPNDRGYRVWTAAFLPAVDRRLAKLGLAKPESS